jgi:magnesium-transporting ATPase (P-type)
MQTPIKVGMNVERATKSVIKERKMANKRVKLFVDRPVQGALARRILVHWCILFGLSLISLFTLEFFLGDPNLTFGGQLQVLWSKYAFFILLMIAIVPTFIYDTVKLSNRFAGPILRLRESIRDLAKGDQVADLKFREDDFWLELSEDFNRVAHRIKDAKA